MGMEGVFCLQETKITTILLSRVSEQKSELHDGLDVISSNADGLCLNTTFD